MIGGVRPDLSGSLGDVPMKKTMEDYLNLATVIGIILIALLLPACAVTESSKRDKRYFSFSNLQIPARREDRSLGSGYDHRQRSRIIGNNSSQDIGSQKEVNLHRWEGCGLFRHQTSG